LPDNYDRIEAIGAVIRETKGANRELLIEWLKSGLLEATGREYGSPQEIEVTWDAKSGDIRMDALKLVVKEVDPELEHLQVSRRKARKYVAEAEIGDKVPIPVDLALFSRSAVNVFRQEFLTLERSAERDQVYQEYVGRIGQLIPRCVIQQVYRNRVIVRVAGQIEAVIPPEERARGERFEHGDTVLPVLVAVLPPESSEPQLILSRATPMLIQRLFEREAPEIDEGVVEIKAIAREAGVRTKIAVASNDIRVDAVGTFVGMKGMRVQSVMRSLNGERIDIIPWTIDRRLLVTSALLPATVLRVETRKIRNEETGEEDTLMVATVPDDEIGRAKGKGGHNVRLAGQLIGCRIEVEERSRWEERKRWEDMLRVDVSELSCVSDKLAERLTRAGFDSAARIVRGPREAILEVHGVGPIMADKLIEEAGRLVDERRELVREEREKVRSAQAEARAAGIVPEHVPENEDGKRTLLYSEGD
jgi:transcription termination/antitermination protein NusA